jgi:hypothetical protein
MPEEAVVAPWADEIPDEQWEIYQRAIQEARARNVRFAMGGAFALAAYTHHWRNTKDLDFYVLPEARDTMVEVLSGIGLDDYFDVLPYQRHWIYRAHNGTTIVDVIWMMANSRAEVDDAWLERGPLVVARGETLRVAPPEEMMWGKIYVMQRDRCDWGDIFNLIHATGPSLDWDHLIARLDGDTQLLGGVLSVFSWLAPQRAHDLPRDLWVKLHLPSPNGAPPEAHQQRVNYLDSREWFWF